MLPFTKNRFIVFSLVSFFFLALSFCLNFHLLRVGLLLHNSDLLLQPLWVEELLGQGKWTAFPFQQSYGGTTLGLMRAGFVFLFEPIFSKFNFHPHGLEPFVALHFLFSYVVIPALIAKVFFWVSRPFFGLVASLLGGILCVSFFPNWLSMMGCDYYFSLIVLGLVWMGLKFRIPDVFDVKKSSLFFALGLFSGFSLYTFRATLIYIVVFFIPFERVYPALQRMLNPLTRLGKILFGLNGVLLLVLVRLFFFGGDVGYIGQKLVRLHFDSHLKTCIVFLALLLLETHREVFSFSVLKKGSLFLLGALIGFSPEIFYFAKLGLLPQSMMMSADSEQMLKTFFTVSNAVSDILVGQGKGVSIVRVEFLSLAQNFSYFLFLGVVLTLIIRLKHDKKAKVLLTGIGLSLFAYLKVYLSGPAESRYLFPIYPVLLLGVSLLFFNARSPFKKILIAVFVFGTAVFHQEAKVSFAREHEVSAKLKQEKIQEVVDEAVGSQVRVVLTDDYWNANAFTFIAHEKVLFVSTEAIWGPDEAQKLIREETRIGVLFTGKKWGKGDSVLNEFGRKFELDRTSLKEIHGFAFGVAKRL